MKMKERIAASVLTASCLFIFTSWVVAQTVKNRREPTASSQKQSSGLANEELIKKKIVQLDGEFQYAVKIGDTKTIDRILSDDFVMVNGRGQSFSKEDLLRTIREGTIIYERQEDSEQTVRVWGDTAVITALLWAKGTKDGEPFEYKVWFSDVYKQTTIGWRYVFAQVSLRLPSQN